MNKQIFYSESSFADDKNQNSNAVIECVELETENRAPINEYLHQRE